jgi:hypothetical protein
MNERILFLLLGSAALVLGVATATVGGIIVYGSIWDYD